MTLPTPTLATAEVWGLDSSGESLVLLDRLVAHSASLADELTCNGSQGSSLAEQAWHQQTPMISSPINGSAAGEVSNDCQVAYPCQSGNELRGVLVLELHFNDSQRGAVEVWSRDERNELGLRNSHFANLELTARISPYVKFPRAAGLPGQSWDTRSPQLLDGLQHHPDFMRASAAKSDGLSTGIALPLMHTEFDLSDVLVFLSSASSPLSHIFEIWKPSDSENAEEPQLVCESVACGSYVDWGPAARDLEISVGTDLAGEAIDLGRPVLFNELPALRSKRGVLAAQYGFQQAISWPIYVGHKADAIVNLIF